MPSSYDGDIRLSVSLEPKDAIKSAQKLRGEVEKVFNKASGIKDVRLTKQLADLDKSAVKANQLSKNLENARKVISDYESNLTNLKNLLKEAQIEQREFKKEADKFGVMKGLDYAQENQERIDRISALKQQLEEFRASSESEYKKATDSVEKYKNALIDVNNRTRVGIVSAESRMTELNNSEKTKRLAEEAKEQERLAKEEALRTAQLQKSTIELQKQVDLARQVADEWSRNDAAGKWTQDISAEIEKTTDALALLHARMAELETTPGGTATEEYSRLASQVDELTGSLANLKWEEQYGAEEMEKMIRAILASESPINNLKTKIRELGHSLLELGKTGVSGILTLKDNIESLGKSSSGAELSAKKLFTTFIKYGLGIRSIYMLFRKVRAAIKEGFNNLSQWNGGNNEVATTINSLKDSLTTLKNSWAAAFAPILQIVAPILQTLINMLVTAANAVASFFAALGGQSKVIKATKAQQNLGSAIGGTGDAAKEAKGQLADFDELNIIQNANDGGGGGGGGGAGGIGGFEYEDVGSDMKDFIDRLKQSWEDADFTWLGKLVGEKLKGALEQSYDFLVNEAMDFAWRLAKSIATFLNGFIEVEGLGNIIGKNIGAAFNVGFKFINTFLREFHWDSLGKFLMEGLLGAFEEFDWGNISEFLSLKFMAIMDFIRGAITAVDWTELPRIVWEAIVEFVQGIDFEGLASSAGKLLGAAFRATWNLIDTLSSLFADTIRSISDYFKEKISEAGGNIIVGLWNGITEALGNVWDWLYTNIFKPIYDGFMEFFKMGSPSKLMEELGRFIMEGLFNGINSFVDAIVNIFKFLGEVISGIWNGIKTLAVNIWNGIKNTVVGVVNGIKEKVTEIWNGISTFISNTWNSIKTTASNVWNGIKTSLSNTWNGLKTTVSNTWDGMKNNVSNVWDSVKTNTGNVWNGIKTSLSNTWSGLKSDTSTKFTDTKNTISNIWNDIKTSMTTTVNNIKTGVSTGFNTLKTAAIGTFNGLKNSLVNIFSGVWSGIRGTLNSIIGGVETMANAVVSGINRVISSLNSINFSIPSWVPMFGGRSFGINLGYVGYVSLPRLAEGAVIPPNKEFIAMLGDQKHGTNIEAPLETIKDAVREVIGEGGNSNAEMIELLQELIDVVASKNLTISKRDIGKTAIEFINSERKRTGNTPIFG